MSELLIKNIAALFCAVDDVRTHCDVRIRGHQIAEIGNDLPQADAVRVLDGRGKVVLPGLINTHHHFFQILTRCLPGGQNAALFDWLAFHYPIWKFIDEEGFRAANRAAMGELLLTGCTTTADHLYLFPRQISTDLIGLQIEAAHDLGIRYCGTRGAMTRGQSQGGLPPDDLCEHDDDVLRHCEECLTRYHDPAEFSMQQVHLAPCSPFNVSERLMQDTARLARKHNVRLHTHLAETEDENDYCREHYGCRPLELMERVGWLGPDVWFAHGIHFNEQELQLLARTQTGICHCPSSNMRLGSGAARVPDCVRFGIHVGLGVDGSASNDSSNMLAELRQAMLLARHEFGSRSMSAKQVIHLATAGSASLLGRAELGRIAVGMAADLALFDLNSLAYAGAFDPIAALLYCGFDQRAWMVLVQGRIVVEDQRLVWADEHALATSLNTAARKLWSRAGLI